MIQRWLSFVQIVIRDLIQHFCVRSCVAPAGSWTTSEYAPVFFIRQESIYLNEQISHTDDDNEIEQQQ